jgi:hypothetical protein
VQIKRISGKEEKEESIFVKWKERYYRNRNVGEGGNFFEFWIKVEDEMMVWTDMMVWIKI